MKTPRMLPYRTLILPLVISLTASLPGAEAPRPEAAGVGASGAPGGPGSTSVFTSKTNTITRTVAATSATPLETSLALWSKGNKDGAIAQFLNIDWSRNNMPFPPGSPLATREQDLAKMSTRDRDALLATVYAQPKDLKQLAAAARDKAYANTDKAVGQQQLAKLGECGKTLDQPGALMILKLTARAIGKLAVNDAGSPGR